MTDKVQIHLGESSPEHIAYKLLDLITTIESSDSAMRRDRKYYLDTFAECLAAVKDPHRRL